MVLQVIGSVRSSDDRGTGDIGKPGSSVIVIFGVGIVRASSCVSSSSSHNAVIIVTIVIFAGITLVIRNVRLTFVFVVVRVVVMVVIAELIVPVVGACFSSVHIDAADAESRWFVCL